VSSLLVFTGAASYVIAAGRSTQFLTLILVAIAVFLGSSAANTVGSYFDRDIDAIMSRTRRRPIPLGTISPEKALTYGLLLLGASLALSGLLLSLLSAAFMLVGFLDYVAVYSYLLKRRTPLNIVLGGFSGVMPILVAYFAAKNPVIPLTAAIFMGFLVFFWIPEHIWSLAIKYKDDYERAKIPMLPVVASERTSLFLIAGTSIAMVAFSLLPIAEPQLGFHFVYISAAAILGAVMLAFNLWLLVRPSKARAWTVFKYSSPYLFFIFSAMMADILIYYH
jgi:protoheme IX farnesyltransferase